MSGFYEETWLGLNYINEDDGIKMTFLKLRYDGNAIEAQAAAWLTRLDSSEVSGSDLEEFSDWLAVAPSHLDVYEALRADGKRFSSLADLTDDEKRDFEQALLTNSSRSGRGHFDLMGKLVGVAAALFICFMGYQNFNRIYVPENTFQTDVGGMRTIALKDGSSITLNTDTQVQVDYGEEARTIILVSGEAFFDVAHDPLRPFIVQVGDKQVRAVGTAFNILRQKAEFSVLVTDGTVEVSERSSQTVSDKLLAKGMGKANLVYVTKGEKINVRDVVGQAEKIMITSVDKELSWQKGLLEFDGETLEGVVDQFSRYTDRKIILVGDDIKHMKVGGVFEAGNVDALVSALDIMLPVKVMKVTPYITFLVSEEQSPENKS